MSGSARVLHVRQTPDEMPPSHEATAWACCPAVATVPVRTRADHASRGTAYLAAQRLRHGLLIHRERCSAACSRSEKRLRSSVALLKPVSCRLTVSAISADAARPRGFSPLAHSDYLERLDTLGAAGNEPGGRKAVERGHFSWPAHQAMRPGSSFSCSRFCERGKVAAAAHCHAHAPNLVEPLRLQQHAGVRTCQPRHRKQANDAPQPAKSAQAKWSGTGTLAQRIRRRRARPGLRRSFSSKQQDLYNAVSGDCE